mmetsp:Transcript_80301/g.134386  ORF Transcript_80301/g.134386 Transcript_80301/m.134386 type:complete len:218 (+) Transcript_80301:1068-1721(+)
MGLSLSLLRVDHFRHDRLETHSVLDMVLRGIEEAAEGVDCLVRHLLVVGKVQAPQRLVSRDDVQIAGHLEHITIPIRRDALPRFSHATLFGPSLGLLLLALFALLVLPSFCGSHQCVRALLPVQLLISRVCWKLVRHVLGMEPPHLLTGLLQHVSVHEHTFKTLGQGLGAFVADVVVSQVQGSQLAVDSQHLRQLLGPDIGDAVAPQIEAKKVSMLC